MKTLAIAVGYVSALLCVGIAVEAFGQTSAITGCVSNSGSLRILNSGQECKPNEVNISWNVAGLQGPQGPTGPTGSQGPEGPPVSVLKAVDASDAVIGDLVDEDTESATVAIEVGNYVGMVTLYRTLFRGKNGGAVYFGSPDCTGAAFIAAPPNMSHEDVLRYLIFPFTVVTGEPGAQTLHMADQTAAQQSLLMQSMLPDGTPGCQPVGAALTVIPVVHSVDLRQFQPPYRVVRK